jgi:cell division protein FtsI/penicillin-binding protein 2
MRHLRLAAATAFLLAGCALGAGVDPDVATTGSMAATSTSEATPPTLGALESNAVADAASDYLSAWSSFEWDRAALQVADPPVGFSGIHEDWRTDLAVESVAFDILRAAATATGGAEVSFHAAVEIGGAGTWEFDGLLPMVRVAGRWRVDWAPAVLHPSLEPGDRLEIYREWPARADILDINGVSIATDYTVKAIGVRPDQIGDLDALVDALETLAGIPAEVITEALEQPGIQPHWFLQVGTLTPDEYAAVADDLEAIPGVVVQDTTERASPADPFADHLLGTTGPITVEILDQLGSPYTVTDTVGRSGLELALERQLAGTPRQEVRRVDALGETIEVLAEFSGAAPSAATVTLDADVQLAVEDALADVEEPAAIVVVDIATGEIRAAASRPVSGFDRAMLGLYPPGSTFKVVTAAALLDAGLTPSTIVECPAETTVLGRTFTNAGGFDLGSIQFRDAFAFSCNTSFAALAAEQLTDEQLIIAAAYFGFGSTYALPVPASSASFPVPADDADRAAAAIGQGRVLASPLHQATVAAAAASGVWRSPRILPDSETIQTFELEEGVSASLDSMMLRVVSIGTGTAAAVPGQEIHGKTGTAEYATEGETHAWFIGYWDDYAFAVIVEGGGFGGEVAAPIAADLVTRLASI